MKEFIDATIFMGMHSADEKIRMACKNFFIERLDHTLFMSLENVGKCDDIVWQFDRETQDTYYPFMDRLHTVMDIQRIPYDQNSIDKRKPIGNLSIFQQLTLAQASDEKLYTVDESLLKLRLDFITSPKLNEEKNFPEDLEKWYQASLKLRVENIERLNQ